MPDNGIVSDEADTCGLPMFPTTVNAPPHEWMTNTGGAIGQGLPLSLGAAIARPNQKVIALQADGSAIRATTAEEFHLQFSEALAAKGPRFIEAMVVQPML